MQNKIQWLRASSIEASLRVSDRRRARNDSRQIVVVLELDSRLVHPHVSVLVREGDINVRFRLREERFEGFGVNHLRDGSKRQGVILLHLGDEGDNLVQHVLSGGLSERAFRRTGA